VVYWWLGNAVLILVVIPTLLLYLNRVLRPALEIKKYADDVLQHGVALTGTLDAVPALLETKQLTGAARTLVGRYGAALERLL
jgi:integral membrane sensor domain MASE1